MIPTFGFTDGDGDGSDQKGREQAVSRRDVLQAGATGLTALVGLAGVSSGKQARVLGLFESDDEPSRFGKAIASLQASVDRIFADEGRRTAKESASETTTVFNENADVLVDYTNEYLDSDIEKTEYNEIRVVFDGEDELVKRWIVADVDEEQDAFTSVKMVDEQPSSTITNEVRLRKLALAEAPDELEYFVDEYAEDSEPIDDKYVGRLSGRYAPDVDQNLY